MRRWIKIIIPLFICILSYPTIRSDQHFEKKCSQLGDELHWSCKTDTFVSEDAIVLTLRLQESMFLDTALAIIIDTVVAVAKTHSPEVGGILAFPNYMCNEILIRSDAPWTSVWLEGELLTGNADLDSLGTKYNLMGISQVTRNIFKLEFQQAMDMCLLGLLYDQIGDVINAGPNYICCDGPDIEAFKKNDIWHLAFLNAWGDCLSGCIYRYYYYLTIDSHLNVSLVNEGDPSLDTPRIYTWNIPRYFTATTFENGDEILGIARSTEDWWVRCHALEVIGRFYVFGKTWNSIDRNYESLFNEIREDILSNSKEIVEILDSLKYDIDECISETARFALNQVDSLYQYFPFHEGDQWIYDCDDGDGFERNILVESRIYTHSRRHGDYSVNYERIFLFDRNVFSQVSVRMNRGGQVYLRVGELEQMWIDFTADAGSSWIVTDFDDQSSPLTVTLQSVTDTVFTPTGAFANCYRFCFKSESGDALWTEWYARGIGLVKRSQHGATVQNCELIGAVIDGEAIGTKKGDVNGDGVVDIQDVVSTINIILGYEEPDLIHTWAADYNDDRIINILDLVGLINEILGF